MVVSLYISELKMFELLSRLFLSYFDWEKFMENSFFLCVLYTNSSVSNFVFYSFALSLYLYE